MHSGNLQEILILLAAAVVIVAVFKRLHLSPVLGYLAAGGAIGPYGLAIIQNVDATRYIAEFGVVFLLFAIGLELTFDRLKSMRLHVFGFGTAQMLLSGALIGLAAYAAGAEPKMAVIIGGGLALSSTAIVLQVLSDAQEQSSQVGRLSLAALILQDLAVVPLLMMVTLLKESNADLPRVIAHSLFNAAVAMVVIFLVGTRLLRPVFHAISSLRSQELFVATTLLIILGAAWATEHSGLSLALGAFLAGLLVAETEYRPQVEADILPFKGLLMGLFFMSVGMSIDFRLLKDKLELILLFTAALMVSKAAVVALLARLFGFRLGAAIHAGLLLCQGGEFAFVLFGLAALSGIFDQQLAQILEIGVSISMALTPLLAIAGRKVSRRLERRNPVHLNPGDISSETLDLEGHIIILGFGRVGKTLCRLLKAEDITNYIAIDNNPTRVHEGRKLGDPVYYGSGDRVELLQAVGIERARLVTITVRDKYATRRIVDAIHANFPHMTIVARAWDNAHAQELRNAGATFALAEAFESSLLLGASILRKTGVPPQEIERVIEQFRQEEFPPAAKEAATPA